VFQYRWMSALHGPSCTLQPGRIFMARLSMTFFDSVSFLFGGSKYDIVLSVLSEPLAHVGGSVQSDRSPQTRLKVFSPPGCLRYRELLHVCHNCSGHRFSARGGTILFFLRCFSVLSLNEFANQRWYLLYSLYFFQTLKFCGLLRGEVQDYSPITTEIAKSTALISILSPIISHPLVWQSQIQDHE